MTYRRRGWEVDAVAFGVLFIALIELLVGLLLLIVGFASALSPTITTALEGHPVTVPYFSNTVGLLVVGVGMLFIGALTILTVKDLWKGRGAAFGMSAVLLIVGAIFSVVLDGAWVLFVLILLLLAFMLGTMRNFH
jgi:hypothetical protein